jgi:hypothetical protein
MFIMLKKILINYFIDFSRLGMDFLNKSRIYAKGFIDKNGCLYNKLSDMGKKWLLD